MAFCLGNLVELLHQILNPEKYHKNWVLDIEKIPQIDSLFQRASFLREFLAYSTPAIQARIETFEDLVRDAAENAEDILDSYLKAQVLLNRSFMTFPPDLTNVRENNRSRIGSFFEKASSLKIQGKSDMLVDVNRGAAENPEDILESYIKAQAHRRQLQSLFQKASFLTKFAESAPRKADLNMLGNVIRGAARNVEDILESYTKDQAIDHENIPQIQSLSGNSTFLNDFFANTLPVIQAIPVTLDDQDLPWLFDIMLSLAGKIKDAAENVRELVLSYPNCPYPNSSGQTFMISPPDMSEVIQVFDSAIAEMIKITDEGARSVNTSPAVTPRRSSYRTSNDVLVGVDKCLIELKDQLTSRSPTLEIIPIVGMGGIGKTTVALKLYNEYSSSKHFDICLWATVSQEYDRRQVILSLLGCIEKKLTTAILHQQDTEELQVTLYKELYNRRYLIVLDDVWSFKVWDDVRRCAPDNNNRSRIIFTTRGNDVAGYVSSRRHEMQLLNKEDSWELFEKIVHAGEKFPDELEEIAQEIVRKCGGLPLALQLIGGVLSRAERIKDLWEKVADDLSSFIAKEDDQFSGIFSWSYANLPHCVKPCLLYMGAFPEDHAIEASSLIKLWVAEGFLHPIKDKSQEEVAEINLNFLVDRNLIFVRARTFSRRAKSYGIHDLLRDLCMKKAEEKRFIFTKKLWANANPYGRRNTLRYPCMKQVEKKRFIVRNKWRVSKGTLCHRRVNIVCAYLCDFSSCMDLIGARSVQAIGGGDNNTKFPSNGFELSLLRVLDVFTLWFRKFPEEISKLVNLKYLALSSESDCKSPLTVAVLENLQTIMFRMEFKDNFVRGISHLKQLRHLKTKFGDPIDVAPRSFFSLGENVQSLKYVTVAVVVQLLGKLPNLKSLEIGDFSRGTEANIIDLTSFTKLEILKIISIYLTPIFPQTLRELTIEGHWELSGTFMSRIGGLPNLQLLRLKECEFENYSWEPSDGEFCSLQYLKLYKSILEDWIADETHFPQLKHLVIDDCDDLKEIPLELGGIECLEIIQVDRCIVSVFKSARRILQQQRYFGNETLQLHVDGELRNEDVEEEEEEEEDGSEST